MHYVFFGAMVLLVSSMFNKKHSTGEITPSVSFIIAAYNEEKIIHQKIINALKLDYPKNKIEIIVVSDGSNDKTADIVNEFCQQNVISIHRSERHGKTDAINRAVASAKNEILLFTDANSIFYPNAVKKLVRHFVDLNIGGVCGQKCILYHDHRKASSGDKLYWRYESALKSAESKLGSIPTADGEIFAIRKALYCQIPPHIINDDMAITLNILAQNKRVIYDREAITEEEASITLKDDFNVKARMVYGSLQVLSLYKNILNPFTSFYALQFFFHKTLRYFMWLLLILIFLLNIMCFNQNIFYKIFFGLQLIFYSMAIVGLVLDRTNHKSHFCYFPYYYCNVNLAALMGHIYYLKRESTVDIWSKAQR